MVRGSATLPRRISCAGCLKGLPVERVVEMHRLEEIGDAEEGLVVDEDCAEERLLDLDIVRALAVDRLVFERQDVGEGH